MTTKEFVVLEKKLLPDLPDFTIKGPLMFIAPVGRILRGISFEGSSFDKESFYATMFMLPLYVPEEYLTFTFGGRLRIRGADRWNVNDPNMFEELRAVIKSEAVPFLSRVKSVYDVVEVAKSHPNPKDPYVQQAIAYAFARAGDVEKAKGRLDELIHSLDLSVSWQQEMADRAQLLKAKLIIDPADAQRQLEAWENETVKNLGLEKFR